MSITFSGGPNLAASALELRIRQFGQSPIVVAVSVTAGQTSAQVAGSVKAAADALPTVMGTIVGSAVTLVGTTTLIDVNLRPANVRL